MGDLIWHQLARLMALTAAAYMLWATLWAFFYPKFFWDFVGGTLGPAGIIPNATSRGFNKIIVTIPLMQIFTMLASMGTLVLEYPLPMVKDTVVHRSHIARIALYLTAAFSGFLVYQTLDCALYFVIAAVAYTRSLLLKETIGGKTQAGRSAA